jgi:hypothetical protein
VLSSHLLSHWRFDLHAGSSSSPSAPHYCTVPRPNRRRNRRLHGRIDPVMAQFVSISTCSSSSSHAFEIPMGSSGDLRGDGRWAPATASSPGPWRLPSLVKLSVSSSFVRPPSPLSSSRLSCFCVTAGEASSLRPQLLPCFRLRTRSRCSRRKVGPVWAQHMPWMRARFGVEGGRVLRSVGYAVRRCGGFYPKMRRHMLPCPCSVRHTECDQPQSRSQNWLNPSQPKHVKP